MAERKYLILYRLHGENQEPAVTTAPKIFSLMATYDTAPGEIDIDIYLLGEYGQRPTRCVFFGKGSRADDPNGMSIVGPYGILDHGEDSPAYWRENERSETEN